MSRRVLKSYLSGSRLGCWHSHNVAYFGRTLELSNNQFTGTLPDTISLISVLQYESNVLPSAATTPAAGFPVVRIPHPISSVPVLGYVQAAYSRLQQLYGYDPCKLHCADDPRVRVEGALGQSRQISRRETVPARGKTRWQYTQLSRAWY